MGFSVEVRNVHDRPTSVGSAGGFTVIIDRPAEAGGGLGFNGAQLLHLAVAGCVSNDLFREATSRGIELGRVVVTADGGFEGTPMVSTGITYEIDVEGHASAEELDALVAHVESIAEIPNSIARGTAVTLARATTTSLVQG